MNSPETPERKQIRHDYWVRQTLYWLRHEVGTTAEIRAYAARWADDAIKAEVPKHMQDLVMQVRDAQNEAAVIYDKEVEHVS